MICPQKKKLIRWEKKEKEKTSCQKKKKKIGQRWAQLFIFDLTNLHIKITNVDQR